MWLKESVDFSLNDDIQGTSPQIQIVYSDSTNSEQEDFQSVSSYGSPADVDLITDYPLYRHAGHDTQDGFQLYSSEPGQNVSFLPKNGTDLTSENNRISACDGIGRPGQRNELTLTQPSRIGQNVKATLAQAALSAVLESDETSVSPTTWFDGQSEEQSHKIRRASTGSLNDNLVHLKNDLVDGNSILETSDLKQGSHDKIVTSNASQLHAQKMFGHYRSKSDQIGVPKSQELAFVVEQPQNLERRQHNSFSRVGRLSSSLPTTSGKAVMCFNL